MTEAPTTPQPTVGRVLLVDDEPDQVALLRAMLTPLGMEVAHRRFSRTGDGRRSAVIRSTS